jgi:hypothetical protein
MFFTAYDNANEASDEETCAMFADVAVPMTSEGLKAQ